ncbi:acyl carrier protein [Microbispora bryophytorum]|uniref:Actinorhodin polyketide synthase acyl carrier protein n=1 Tax=Microbispora bryophytorum TaxID=1460882 RepID=A0A8H9LCH3_9ACTN|nr:acyl carrier protein [Microbispora bryophytorum]MBD3136422.1 acyl carrier protein [Microbispora bryophytorum]TQS08134.1 acyl carrier protein [Microbispora bryophytorum]GGO06211.1 actinorhodin polyketide synthase acyl carrier protein [Microbispora bryophytorum]
MSQESTATPRMTAEDLLGILRTCAGVADDIVLDDKALDTDFGSLGYDSIALLEVTANLERTFHVDLDDDAIKASDTPRDVISMINSR